MGYECFILYFLIYSFPRRFPNALVDVGRQVWHVLCVRFLQHPTADGVAIGVCFVLFVLF